jgi:hypothetical protein
MKPTPQAVESNKIFFKQATRPNNVHSGRKAQLVALGDAVAQFMAQGGVVQALPPANTPKARIVDTWQPKSLR